MGLNFKQVIISILYTYIVYIYIQQVFIFLRIDRMSFSLYYNVYCNYYTLVLNIFHITTRKYS